MHISTWLDASERIKEDRLANDLDFANNLILPASRSLRAGLTTATTCQSSDCSQTLVLHNQIRANTRTIGLAVDDFSSSSPPLEFYTAFGRLYRELYLLTLRRNEKVTLGIRKQSSWEVLCDLQTILEHRRRNGQMGSRTHVSYFSPQSRLSRDLSYQPSSTIFMSDFCKRRRRVRLGRHEAYGRERNHILQQCARVH